MVDYGRSCRSVSLSKRHHRISKHSIRAYSYEKPFIVVGVGDGAGNVTWPTDLNPDYDESTNPNVFRAMPAGVPANVDKHLQTNPLHSSELTFLLLAGGQSEVYIRFQLDRNLGIRLVY